MTTDIRWRIAPKRGADLKDFNLYIAVDWIKAIREMAKSESKIEGIKISHATIVFNLTLREDKEVRAKRTKLREIYIRIKKERERNESTTNREAGSSQTD